MTDQMPQPNNQIEKKDPFRFYASPVGVRFLQRANRIYEDFPASKYLLYFAIFTVEILIAFWFAMAVIR